MGLDYRVIDMPEFLRESEIVAFMVGLVALAVCLFLFPRKSRAIPKYFIPGMVLLQLSFGFSILEHDIWPEVSNFLENFFESLAALAFLAGLLTLKREGGK